MQHDSNGKIYFEIGYLSPNIIHKYFKQEILLKNYISMEN
jgi:hypothetical protein